MKNFKIFFIEKNNLILLILITFLVFGCQEDKKNSFDCIQYQGTILNGIYRFELEDGVDNFSDTYILVFEGNRHYIFFPHTEESVGYHTTTFYYINEDKFYSCGIDNSEPTGIKSLENCIEDKFKFKYYIISMENTIDQFNNKIHQIKLKTRLGNRFITLTKDL